MDLFHESHSAYKNGKSSNDNSKRINTTNASCMEINPVVKIMTKVGGKKTKKADVNFEPEVKYSSPLKNGTIVHPNIEVELSSITNKKGYYGRSKFDGPMADCHNSFYFSQN